MTIDAQNVMRESGKQLIFISQGGAGDVKILKLQVTHCGNNLLIVKKRLG